MFSDIESLFSTNNGVDVKKNNENNIKIHFNGNLTFDYTISFKDFENFDEQYSYILIKLNSNIPFKCMDSFK